MALLTRALEREVLGAAGAATSRGWEQPALLSADLRAAFKSLR